MRILCVAGIVLLALCVQPFDAAAEPTDSKYVVGQWTGALISKSKMVNVDVSIDIKAGKLRGALVIPVDLNFGVEKDRTFTITKSVLDKGIWHAAATEKATGKQITFTLRQVEGQIGGGVSGWEPDDVRVVLVLSKVKALGEIEKAMRGLWKGEWTIYVNGQTSKRTLELDIVDARGHLEATEMHPYGRTKPADKVTVKGRKITVVVLDIIQSPWTYALTLSDDNRRLSGSISGGIGNATGSATLHRERGPRKPRAELVKTVVGRWAGIESVSRSVGTETKETDNDMVIRVWLEKGEVVGAITWAGFKAQPLSGLKFTGYELSFGVKDHAKFHLRYNPEKEELTGEGTYLKEPEGSNVWSHVTLHKKAK